MPQASLRPRRQITLPRDICRQLGVDIGDQLDLSVEDEVLVATPSKKRALNALSEIQAAFARSGISERELQRASGQSRAELARERYGRKRKA